MSYRTSLSPDFLGLHLMVATHADASARAHTIYEVFTAGTVLSLTKQIAVFTHRIPHTHPLQIPGCSVLTVQSSLSRKLCFYKVYYKFGAFSRADTEQCFFHTYYLM